MGRLTEYYQYLQVKPENLTEFKDKAVYHVFINNRYEENVDWNKNIRVKYLDEQDILNLGFKYTNNDLDLIKKQDDKTIRIRYRVIDDEPHLRIYENSNRSYKDEWLLIFLGKIKNKSELRKLLTQLEITI